MEIQNLIADLNSTDDPGEKSTKLVATIAAKIEENVHSPNELRTIALQLRNALPLIRSSFMGEPPNIDDIIKGQPFTQPPPPPPPPPEEPVLS